MFHRIGAAAYRANLDNTISVCEVLGNPQANFAAVHIAGTNGKGSTSSLIASILQEAGYKTGLFTSPHLVDFRERIRVNGEKIPESKVIEFVEKYRADFEDINPSFFEWTFGLATHYFSENKVDIAVIETGMGGRLDSTNLVHPILTIITNIGFDHMAFLGNSLEKIAVEKAGIMKPGVPVIIGETHSKTAAIFQAAAKGKNSRISFADRLFYLRKDELSKNLLHDDKIDIYRGRRLYIKNLRCPLLGNYQQRNIKTVFAGIEELKKLQFEIQPEHISEGFSNVVKNTGLAGRWQVLQQSPLIILDTAHNIDGLKYVTNQIKNTPHDSLHFVLGMVNDKDIDNILCLLPTRAQYYFCKADIPRGLPAEELAACARKKGLKGSTYISVNEAFNSAKDHASGNDLIFVGGSTFTVAEVLSNQEEYQISKKK